MSVKNIALKKNGNIFVKLLNKSKVMRLKVLLILFLVLGGKIFAQAKIENFKYIIVPTKFEFQSEEDQYRVNTLIRMLFKDKGYDVYFENQSFPDELARNNCKALKANMETWGLFDTKSIITLADCKGNVIFTSEEGRSKVKEYKKAYHETIKLAFESIQDFRYEEPLDKSIYYELDVVEENTVLNTDNIGIDQFYNYNDDIYILISSDNGYDIIKKNFSAVKKEDQNIKVGSLIKSSRENSFILKMDSIQASAYFDKEGNLVFDKIDDLGNIKTQTFYKVK